MTLLFAGETWAAGGSVKKLYLGTGTFFYNMGKVTSSDDASTSLLGQFYIPLNLSMRIPLSTATSLIPNVTYTPIGSTAADSVTKKILSFGMNAMMNTHILDLKGGLGLLTYSISGTGGTVTRNNGASTATFYLPGSTQSSSSIFIDLGVGTSFGSDFRLDLDFIGVSMLSTRRAISTALLLSKGIF